MDVAELLATYREAIGGSLLCYLLDVNMADLGSLESGRRAPTAGQRAVLLTMNKLIDVNIPPAGQSVDRADVFRAVLSSADQSGRTVASQLRVQAGGAIDLAAATNELEKSIAQLAADTFPLFLLPRGDQYPMPLGDANIYVIRHIFTHPARQRFEAALLKDRDLAALFGEPEPEGAGSRSTMVWRNTGSGGSLQSTLLPQFILAGAWRHVKVAVPTQAVFGAVALAQMRLVTSLLKGSSQRIEALFGFTGVLLPEGVSKVDMADGTVERVSELDRERAPASLRQELRGTDAAGNTVVIHYDGDLLLRLSFPFKVKARPWTPGELGAWPGDVGVPDTIDRVIERLRLSLTLAVQREHRVQLIPTWRYFDDPFGYGSVTSWFDPKNAVGIMPTQLTAGEVESWKTWFSLLRHPDVDRIGLAIMRIIRAIAERREPADVLIDAVIAWENIFGTSEGEPTLRVTASLALLLESDPAKRRLLQERLRKIYRLRSGVVHGSKAIDSRDVPLCQEALDVAIRAVRVLAKDRPDVLALADGAARSLHVILGSAASVDL